jgi:hypothetical protein
LRSPALSDLTIVGVLRDNAPTPVPAHLLAKEHELTVEELTLRMKSLVSLRYVDYVPGTKGDAYVLGIESLPARTPDSERLSTVAESP